jgi:hypothetical protein
MVFSGAKRLGVSGTIVVVCVANCNTYQLVFGCCFFITTSTILLAFFFVVVGGYLPGAIVWQTFTSIRLIVEDCYI